MQINFGISHNTIESSSQTYGNIEKNKPGIKINGSILSKSFKLPFNIDIIWLFL